MKKLALLLLLIVSFASAANFSVQDQEGNDLQIEVLASEGDLVTLWFNDLAEEERPHFQELLESLHQSGIEVWSSRILGDLFLTRDDRTVMELSGERIARIIEAAHRQTEKRILLLSYDRMSIPLLRGVRRWQQSHPESNQLGGVVLLYPNLFIAPERAGDAAEPAPILSLTNVPVTLFQPEKGQHAKRISQVMERLWDAGSSATLYPVADIRDWYIMHDPEKDPAERRARQQLPRQLRQIAQQIDEHPFPAAPLEKSLQSVPTNTKDLYRLTPIEGRSTASDFMLKNLNGKRVQLSDLRGKVVLVNFWASWCPPCIEEMPSMNTIYTRYREQGLEILAINFQENPDEIRPFQQKVEMAFPVLFDHNGAVAHQWNVFSLPSSFLIDREGRLRYSVSRSIHWDLPETLALLNKLIEE